MGMARMGVGVIVGTMGTIGAAGAVGTTGIMCCAGRGKVGSTRSKTTDRLGRRSGCGKTPSNCITVAGGGRDPERLLGLQSMGTRDRDRLMALQSIGIISLQ